MIDIHKEHIIPLSEAPCHLPKRPNGKKIHISALYRWISRGVQGVVLESARIGRCTYTSLEALQRWSDALTNANGSAAEARLQTPKSRKRQIDNAAKQVIQKLEK